MNGLADTLHTATALFRCGNVASILELDENLNPNYKTFDAAAQVRRPLLLREA